MMSNSKRAFTQSPFYSLTAQSLNYTLNHYIRKLSLTHCLIFPIIPSTKSNFLLLKIKFFRVIVPH